MDWYGNLTTGVIDPQGASGGDARVMRGGGKYHWYISGVTPHSVYYSDETSSSSYRSSVNPAEPHLYYYDGRSESYYEYFRGFRIVKY